MVSPRSALLYPLSPAPRPWLSEYTTPYPYHHVPSALLQRKRDTPEPPPPPQPEQEPPPRPVPSAARDGDRRRRRVRGVIAIRCVVWDKRGNCHHCLCNSSSCRGWVEK